jgi:hypothetical protein
MLLFLVCAELGDEPEERFRRGSVSRESAFASRTFPFGPRRGKTGGPAPKDERHRRQETGQLLVVLQINF